MANVYVDVDLDDFDEDDLIKHLESNGWRVIPEKATKALDVGESYMESFVNPANLNDEMKRDLLCKAYKNYTLDQLEAFLK
jgi:hypothetical protein